MENTKDKEVFESKENGQVINSARTNKQSNRFSYFLKRPERHIINSNNKDLSLNINNFCSSRSKSKDRIKPNLSTKNIHNVFKGKNMFNIFKEIKNDDLNLKNKIPRFSNTNDLSNFNNIYKGNSNKIIFDYSNYISNENKFVDKDKQLQIFKKEDFILLNEV